MDKKETSNSVENNIEDTFVINLNQKDDVDEEKMENNSNLDLGDTLNDEEYFLECARENDTNELIHFLNQGFNVNSTDQRKNTALHMAAANGHLEAAKLLINNNINLNLINESGNTSLHWGAFNGYFDMVKLLCDYNIDIMIVNQDGKLASQLAYENGFYDISEYLIEKEIALKKGDIYKIEEENQKENEENIKDDKVNNVK